MDKNEVAIINPKIILVTLVPTILIIVSAIRLCRFHFSIALEYTVGLYIFPVDGGQKSYLQKQNLLLLRKMKKRNIHGLFLRSKALALKMIKLQSLNYGM